ncbi:hypothetical protein WK23_21135 [Burkholderia vietnamiensis]|nr:hypothetical protein WK23_21135 [Burkholderia vietnamiensis]
MKKPLLRGFFFGGMVLCLCFCFCRGCILCIFFSTGKNGFHKFILIPFEAKCNFTSILVILFTLMRATVRNAEFSEPFHISCMLRKPFDTAFLHNFGQLRTCTLIHFERLGFVANFILSNFNGIFGFRREKGFGCLVPIFLGKTKTLGNINQGNIFLGITTCADHIFQRVGFTCKEG